MKNGLREEPVSLCSRPGRRGGRRSAAQDASASSPGRSSSAPPSSIAAETSPALARIFASIWAAISVFSLRKDLAFSRPRSEEHTSELQSLMRISYAVFCLKKKKLHIHQQIHSTLYTINSSTTYVYVHTLEQLLKY